VKILETDLVKGLRVEFVEVVELVTALEVDLVKESIVEVVVEWEAVARLEGLEA